MFKATKPFKDTVTSNPEEPSLRIGKRVPENAVNLAYYCNPLATDAEKVLTSEAPRNTIDHRVEEAYRYLFDQASDDDDLFPGYVTYEDEEGYQGRLGRMYVKWYPEIHTEMKNARKTQEIIVTDKADIPKITEYEGTDGYTGSLYFDSADYEVTKTKTIYKTEVIDRKVYNHELNYNEIFGTYISASDIDNWMREPKTADTMWPHSIEVGSASCTASGGHVTVQNFVNTSGNPYDGATGKLFFSNIEYEPVYVGDSSLEDGIETEIETKFKSDTLSISACTYEGKSLAEYLSDPDVKAANKKASLKDVLTQIKDSAMAPGPDGFRYVYEAEYDTASGEYKYDDINAFLTMAGYRCDISGLRFPDVLRDAMDAQKDICVYMRNMVLKMKINGDVISDSELDELPDDTDYTHTKFYIVVHYNYIIGSKTTSSGIYQYNVIANYATGPAEGEHIPLKKENKITKEIPAEYRASCHYVGIVRKVWYDYDGMAYYRGAVTKGNSIGNLNADGNNEILMFSDENGYLRRPMPVTDEYGETSIKNFYRIESDYIYLTDVFKDNIACFYRYILKKPIYDYRGPDSNGFYEGDAVKIYSANMKDVPKGYVHNMKLKIAEMETVDTVTDDFHISSASVPKRYNAELYTSFISSSTDTFKAVYNAFNDSNEDNVVIDNGEIEEIYNYPFMIEGIDFMLESVDEKARINKIKLPEPKRFEDTRYYVSFWYSIIAERKSDGSRFETSPRFASILNKDYALACEYDKFDGRGMIISPMVNGSKASPFDLVLYEQAASGIPPVITSDDTDFIFSARLIRMEKETENGAVNLKCNPDGSGYITAETTIDTGFYDSETGRNTKMLSIDNPYLIEDGYIYPGFKVKCMDARNIKINSPRQDNLLESWYPMVQFGHYSQILDQYGAHIKVCYSMPEYDKQHYSAVYKKPCVDITFEKVSIINSHMVKVSCYPLFLNEINIDEDTYEYKGKIFKVYKKAMTWKEAQAFCKSIGGNLAMPKTQKLGEFIINIATKYSLDGLWLGGTDEETEGVWKWVDGTAMTYNNWNDGEPNNLDGEHYLETYTNTNRGKWNDLSGTAVVSGFICEFDKFNTIKLYKKMDDEMFSIGIKDVSFSDGVIITDDTISENDNIVCSYTYVEENYVYRGFWRNEADFARIDLNPNKYHTYSDLNYTPSEIKQSKNLFNKVIYFFMRPAAIYKVNSEKDSLIFDIEDGEIGDILLENNNTLYHQIDNSQPESDYDVYIGSVYIRQNTSLHSTKIVDARTRGGGIIESMPDSIRSELEPESDYYLDIGYYDGKPYQENGIIIVRLDNRILKEFGGRFTHSEVETKVKRWLGFGVYPIIEYVNSYEKYDMPQYNLTVEDSYTNMIDETPEIFLECISI